MKTFDLLLLVALIFTNVNAQNASIDSLQHLLEYEKQDSVKMKLLLDLGNELSVEDTARASQYYNEAIELGKELGTVQLINAAREKSNYLRKTRRKDLAISFLNDILNETSAKEIPELELLYTGIGIAHYQSYQPDSAANYFRKGIALARKFDRAEREGILLMNIGNTNYLKGRLDSALFYYARSQEVFSRTKSYHRMAQLHITKSIIYQNMKDFPNAERELNSALELEMPNKQELLKHRSKIFNMKSTLHFLKNEYLAALVHIDSAIYLYEIRKEGEEVMKALRLKSNILLKQGNINAAQDILWQLYDYQEGNVDPYERASVLRDLGSSFSISGNHKEAIRLFRQALKYSKTIDIKNVNIYVLNNLGATYLSTGQYDSAKWFLDQAINDTGTSEKRPESYYYMAKYYVAVNQTDSALLYANLLINDQKVRDIPSIYYGAKFIQASANYSKGKLGVAEHFAYEIILQEKQVNSLNIVRDSYELMYRIKSDQNKFEDALYAFEKYQMLHDSVVNLDNLAQGIRLQFESAYDRQQLRDSLQYAEKEQLAKLEQQKSEIQLSNQRITIISIGSVTVLLLVITVILFRNNRSSNRKNKLIGEQKASIEKSLSEKEILLKEIHHRVKNNLQTISSLLNLQAQHLDKSAQVAVEEGRNRVKSMAMIHQKLYQGTDLTSIEFDGYIKQLAESLFQTYHVQENEITLKLDIDPISLDIDTAIPLGLILNELLSNALKHAFPDKSSGEVSVTLKEKDQMLMLVISDNGIGMDKETKENFGMKLIAALSERLQANMKQRVENGTSIQLEIKNYKLAS